MKNLIIYSFCIFCISFCLLSCSKSNERGKRISEWMKPNDKLKVLSTIEMIDDVVKEIGGEYVDGIALINGELDPHSYQLVKGDDEKFSVADIVFYNGLNLEHGPSLKKTLQENPNAFAIGDLIREEEPDLILEYNNQIDPHIWMDIAIWKRIIPHIVKILSKFDPKHAEEYKLNGEKLEKEFKESHDQIYEELQKIPQEKRYLVTSHDAFNYFTRSYLSTEEELIQNSWQKRFAAPEGLAPDSQLSSADIKGIVDHLKKHQIQVLFPESNLSHDSINKIVEAGKSKGLNLSIANCPLYADAMGPAGSDGDSYLKMVKHNARLIGLYLRDYNPRTEIKCK